MGWWEGKEPPTPAPISLRGVTAEKHSPRPSPSLLQRLRQESGLHTPQADTPGCDGGSERTPAPQVADSNTHAAAAGLPCELTAGTFLWLICLQLPPRPLLATPLPTTFGFQLPFLLNKGFTRNKKGILHSNQAVSVGGLQATHPTPPTPLLHCSLARGTGIGSEVQTQSVISKVLEMLRRVCVRLKLLGLLGNIPSAYLGEG